MRETGAIMNIKSVLVFLLTLLMFIPSFVNAETKPTELDIITIDDDYYFETIIGDESASCINTAHNFLSQRQTTKTNSKTTYCKNKSGNVLWYVKVTGTFTYGNGSAKCIKSVCTAETRNTEWTVSNKSSSKIGNKATATATGTHYINKKPIETIAKTVTLKCSPTGEFS